MEKEKILENVINYLGQRDKPAEFIKGKTEVPVSGSKLSYFDIINLVDAALDGWMTEGKWAEKFKRSLSNFTGYHHVTLCNSGSSANLLALSAIKEKYKVTGQKLVLTSALAFPTTVAPIIQTGLIPCFIDIDPYTLNPDIRQIEDALQRKKDIAGIMLAHTLGFPYQAKEIDQLCKDEGLFFIQDQCDALGAKTNDGEQLCFFGDAATLSFFPAHQISTGEGGAVLCNDGRLMRVIESYSNWGRDCWCRPGEMDVCGKRFEQEFEGMPKGHDHKYIFSRVGYNMKMTELQAALGTSQMNDVKCFVSIRRVNYNYLKLGFKAIPNFSTFFSMFRCPVLSSPFGFPLRVNPEVTSREEVVGFLEDRKIRTRPIFAGNITRQPMMKSVPYDQVGTLENCNRVMEDAFWLGVQPGLSEEQLDYVIESFADFVGQRTL